jgi:BirA family biotin operon repressor/biotin-[acetyl-CoA-carboxylase] ligase
VIAEPGRPPLSAAALRRAVLAESRLWTALEVVEETGSTNADVAAAARAGAAEGLVVVAEQQHAGRGRAGRHWSSPPRAGLTVSVLLRPGGSPTRWGWLPLLAGVALAEAVTTVAGVPATLKWPNDLLVGDGQGGGGAWRSRAGGEYKCAGILAEAGGEAVVVGVGLNVTLRAGELPEPAPGGLPATSLALAGAYTTDRGALLGALLAGIEGWYGRWRATGGDAERCGLRAAYLRACATLGRPVRVQLPDGVALAGTADTVDAEGRLVLRTAAGARSLAAGDVVHLRAAAPGSSDMFG